MPISMHGGSVLVDTRLGISVSGRQTVEFDYEDDLDNVDTVVSFTNCSGDETKYGQCHHLTEERTDENCLMHYARIFCQGKYLFRRWDYVVIRSFLHVCVLAWCFALCVN